MAIGEYINHYNAIRVRVKGTGDLRLRLLSLPDNNEVQREQILTPIDMDNIGRNIPTVLANFKEHAAQLEIKTTEIDEQFVINRIIIYVLPTETSYPG